MENLTLQNSHSIMSKHPDFIPIVLITDENISNKKLLLHKDNTVSYLMAYIRQKNKLNKFEAYYIFAGDILLIQSESMLSLYKQYMHPNGFLYFTIKKENTFG